MNEGTKIKKIMRLTIVIPVYREHHRLAVALKKIKAVLADTTDVEVDVVYVDDGSPADSAVSSPRMRVALTGSIPAPIRTAAPMSIGLSMGI